MTTYIKIGSGNLSNVTLMPGDNVIVSNKAVWNASEHPGRNIKSGGTFIVRSGGTLSGANIVNGATLVVNGGGAVPNVVLRPGGNVVVQNGYAWGDEKNTNFSVKSGGTLTVKSGGTLRSETVRSGGALRVESKGILSGAVTLQNGASATIWSTAGGTINLVGDTNHGLTVSGMENGGTLNTVIAGWSGNKLDNSDRINLAGVDPGGATYRYSSNDQVVVTLRNRRAITLNIRGVKTTGFALVSDGRGGSFAEVCFLAGSMIRTTKGDVAIEDIKIGDEIITFDWRNHTEVARPVVWTGKARCDVRPHLSDDMAGYPVRVLKDAVSDGVPYKDLLVTSEHCLFFDSRFVPVRMLVNGRSIFYDKSITSYDYYHIETEDHSVITANGMLTESYLDTGNRSSFRQDKKIAARRGALKAWENDAQAPLSVGRQDVEPLFRQLDARAKNAGLQNIRKTLELTDDSNLYLMTENETIIRPARESNGRAIFMIPADLKSVRIVSNVSRPSDVIGPFVDDRRSLGVLVGDIMVFESCNTHSVTVHLTDADLAGWESIEVDNMRWTHGSAYLPLGSYSFNGIAVLAIEIKAGGPYPISHDEYCLPSSRLAQN